MKQLLFALFTIGLIGYVAFVYVVPSMIVWTEYGRNNFRNMIVLGVSVGILPKPLAYIVVRLTELFFPIKTKPVSL